MRLHPIDFAIITRACGGTGFTFENPVNCGEIPDQALATDGPVLIEAVVDPHEPPLPAEITTDQALKFAEVLAKGAPKRMKIAVTITEDKVREII